MTGEYHFTIFGTPMGYVGILGSNAGLRITTLPQPSEKEVENLLLIKDFSAVSTVHLYRDLVQRIQRYYEGDPVDFPDKLDLSDATPFQRAVWQATRLVPYGETRSYLWIAGQIGQPGAPRAVGQALHRNPLPLIVPCHRVIGSNGRLVGFGGGTDLKRSLLELEKSI